MHCLGCKGAVRKRGLRLYSRACPGFRVDHMQLSHGMCPQSARRQHRSLEWRIGVGQSEWGRNDDNEFQAHVIYHVWALMNPNWQCCSQAPGTTSPSVSYPLLISTRLARLSHRPLTCYESPLSALPLYSSSIHHWRLAFRPFTASRAPDRTSQRSSHPALHPEPQPELERPHFDIALHCIALHCPAPRALSVTLGRG